MVPFPFCKIHTINQLSPHKHISTKHNCYCFNVRQKNSPQYRRFSIEFTFKLMFETKKHFITGTNMKKNV